MADTEDRSLPVVIQSKEHGGFYTALNADQADYWTEEHGGWKRASKTAQKDLEKSDAVPAPGTGTAKEK